MMTEPESRYDRETTRREGMLDERARSVEIVRRELNIWGTNPDVIQACGAILHEIEGGGEPVQEAHGETQSDQIGAVSGASVAGEPSPKDDA